MDKLSKEIEQIRHGGVKSLLNKAMSLGIKISFCRENTSLVKLEHKGKKSVY